MKENINEYLFQKLAIIFQIKYFKCLLNILSFEMLFLQSNKLILKQ